MRIGCVVVKFLPAVPIADVVIPLAVNCVVSTIPVRRVGNKELCQNNLSKTLTLEASISWVNSIVPVAVESISLHIDCGEFFI